MSGQNWLRGRTLVYNPIPKVSNPPRRFPVFRILVTALKRTCIVLGAFFLGLIVLSAMIGSQLSRPAPMNLPSQFILSLDLSGELPESRRASQYLAQFGLGQNEMTISDVVDSIDTAAKDSRVKALALTMANGGYELSQLQEIRAAVKRFKAAGKPTRVYATSYGDGGAGLGMYYLASAFDEIWMQPVGVVSISGISAEMPFFRKLMDKYGVTPEFFQRKEYKNAMEHLTSTQMSDASRREMTELLNDMGGQIVDGVSSDRKKLAGNFRSLVDIGFFTDKDALKRGLIDRLDYNDVFEQDFQKKIAGKSATENNPEFVDAEDYWTVQSQNRIDALLKKAERKTSVVALIYIEGMILDDAGDKAPVGMGDRVAGARQISDAIHEAADDKRVRSIVLRINSPGGSPSSSETIYRAIVWAQTVKQKPVIVSMGNAAASGGYWIASPATRIYALDSTLTGSIGVVGGKVDASGLMDKFDVNWDRVNFGKNAGMWSFVRPFTPEGQAMFESSLDNVYDHFIDHVAKGRKMSPEKVEEIAKGRVWTGRQALKIGLVDQIGGLDMVLDDLARGYRVKDRHALTIISLPKNNSPLDIFYDLMQQGAFENTPIGSVARKMGVSADPLYLQAKSPRMVYDDRLVAF